MTAKSPSAKKPRRIRKRHTIRPPRPGAEPTPVKTPVRPAHSAPDHEPGTTIAKVVRDRTDKRRGTIHPPGPRATEVVLGRIDTRTREGRTLKKFRNDLTAYVAGIHGDLDVIKRLLIERAVMLHLRVRMMDDRFLATATATEADHRYYLAYTNSLVAILLRLIPKNAMDVLPPPPPSFATYLAQQAAEVLDGDADGTTTIDGVTE